MGGWEPRQTITYLFERVWWKPWTWFPVGATIAVEPEWTLTEVDWAIASRDFEAGIGQHGHPLDESTASAANPANPDATYYYITDENPETDWAMKAQQDAADAYRKKWPDVSLAGRFFPVRKVWRNR